MTSTPGIPSETAPPHAAGVQNSLLFGVQEAGPKITGPLNGVMGPCHGTLCRLK